MKNENRYRVMTVTKESSPKWVLVNVEGTNDTNDGLTYEEALKVARFHYNNGDNYATIFPSKKGA